MMFDWIPLSSQWRYGYDTALMHRGIEVDIIYMCDEFGVHGTWKLYVEVIRTWCFMAKHENGWHHDTHHFWHGRNLLITFHLQGLRMILNELEDCGVQSVGGVCMRHQNGSKWGWNGNFELKWLTASWCESLVPQCFLCVWSWYICIPNVCACRKRGLDF